MLRTRQRLGKYVIERRLGEGGYANVYQARDTIEGIRVALKIPHQQLIDRHSLEDFRREVRLAARLDHPHILPLKDASFIEGRFVITTLLGERTLAERLTTRLGLKTSLHYVEQLLDAVSYSHSRRIIHCDIKPENLILFPGNHLRLADFGIARFAQRTLQASGSGTIGYIAPEQALGKPSFASDVFSLGLVICRMLTGQLPEWPFHWPPDGYQSLRRRVHPDMIALIRRALEMQTSKRFADAKQMYRAYLRIKPRAMLPRKTAGTRRKQRTASNDWQTVRKKVFLRQYGKLLQARHTCPRCAGPVSEPMQNCPWCGKERRVHTGKTTFPSQCPRCHRGMKLDWVYCPWCFGAGFELQNGREYSDVRYSARCSNSNCRRKSLMPFMKYCPWCRTKVRRRWQIADNRDKCPRCSWGVLKAYWSHCPWCSRRLGK